MTKVRKLWAAGLLVVLALVSACNDDAPTDDAESTESDTTTTTSSETSATPTTRADDYTIPAVIDAEYVDRVLAALNHVDGDALRLAIKENNLTKDVTDRILAINTAGYVNIPLASYSDLQLGGFQSVKPDPGDPVMKSIDIATAKSACILALVTADYSARAAEQSKPLDTYVVLAPASANQDPHEYNPTPWAIDNVFVPESIGSIPEASRCAG